MSKNGVEKQIIQKCIKMYNIIEPFGDPNGI